MSYNDQTLSHHGIKGMKWGVRRFQKKDGSLTSAGKSRYGDTAEKVGSALKNLDAAGRTKVGEGLYSKSSHKGQLSDGYQKHKNPGLVMDGPKGENDSKIGKGASVTGKAAQVAKNIKGIKLSKGEVRSKAADIIDHLESEMFFKGDNIKNNFAIRAGMRSVSENLRSGTGLLDTTIDALNEYKFFADD